MITVHKISDFKPRAGRIFDAAKKSPQYVVRGGVLLVIKRAEPESELLEVPRRNQRLMELDDSEGW
jgi:hypothetical protein